ncbi:hypothetical protein BAZ12_19430 [Elizabethkingia miricola]|uniref:hypothetical protein n=1 Tax=Elizabethkingia TaxID=308865 RepID=UPI00099ADE6B|nr:MULTISPECIES: hypothetical protein [Elizabethkingia]MCL1654254.1 hypothetical protein [Elizabethkingia miricola]MCT4143013.1 hypothetical protein [Elizabethkingia anophelis]OPC76183.1 hypothetical protein BAZ12_19430 [Elizabethkingia miricola]QCO45827.1 hypothetical protein FCS00_05365 [Elizabethkingia sp. 2-6]
MLLTDKEYMQLSTILEIIARIVGEGFKGRDGFTKKAKQYIKNTEIEIATVIKVAGRLELFLE